MAPIVLLAMSIATSGPAQTADIENSAYKLALRIKGDLVYATLDDKQSGLRLADGPMVYRTDAGGHESPSNQFQLRYPRLVRNGDRLTIQGKLSGVDLTQVFELPQDGAQMEETISLVNRTKRTANLPDIECGFTRLIAGAHGEVVAGIAEDRWVAVPLRARADDPSGYIHDYSTKELASTPGSEPNVAALSVSPQAARYEPSRHRWSEGWAWSHGDYTLGVFKFCQKNMLFSVLSTSKTSQGTVLRFGGVCRISGEPSAIHRLKPGETVDLGLNRYETTRSDFRGAMYAFRRFLDERGCRFPASYNPQVHWEQLYDMPGAWDDRAHRYTKAIVEREAQKGVEYSCEALYLDPGWDTAMASFLWGPWLGPRKQFVEEMKSKYGLEVSLHCPLAPWMSCGFQMGPPAASTYPKSALIAFPPEEVPQAAVPAVWKGRRNLALAPGAKAAVSSTIPGYDIHQPAHLNDGWYGNAQSWIPERMPAWAEIDLPAPYSVSAVRLGNDRLGEFRDRKATSLKILVDSPSGWKQVAEYNGPGFLGGRDFEFPAVRTSKVRVEILKGADPSMAPRLDEIEVYEAQPVARGAAKAFEGTVKRGPRQASGLKPTMCLGSKQYLDTAAKRLLENCADGATFLMFDGNWWAGGCVDPKHGHPIPYTPEDHTRANLELARRVHAKYPRVLIEMHDVFMGGNPSRLTPVYYKYGLPGSYDENWGFELMWDPMADLKAGRARSLYYYNLGCNVPIYLHIDLRGDDADCVVLWWYASTCRHLGIGGTHGDPLVVEAQKKAMKLYHTLEAYYKRGEFYGVDEQIHVHTLKDGFVVNAFNLSDAARTVTGNISLAELGFKPGDQFEAKGDWANCDGGKLTVKAEMNPWGAKVIEFKRTGG